MLPFKNVPHLQPVRTRGGTHTDQTSFFVSGRGVVQWFTEYVHMKIYVFVVTCFDSSSWKSPLLQIFDQVVHYNVPRLHSRLQETPRVLGDW